MRKTWIALALAAVLAAPAWAAPPAARNFTVKMDGNQEVPPRATDAKGTAVLNLSPDGTELRYNVTVTRITNVVGGHIHVGKPGFNGIIAFGFYNAPPAGGRHNGLLVKGTLKRGDNSFDPAFNPQLSLEQRFDALIALLRSGNAYINIHTNDGVAPTNTGAGDFPGGEIRGQVTPKP